MCCLENVSDVFGEDRKSFVGSAVGPNKIASAYMFLSNIFVIGGPGNVTGLCVGRGGGVGAVHKCMLGKFLNTRR